MILASIYAIAGPALLVLTLIVAFAGAAAGRWIGAAGLALAALLIAASAALPGLIFAAERYLQDFWVMMEAAKRAAEGGRSSVDYFNPIGPVQDWLMQAAVRLRAPDETSVPLAGALAAAGALALAVLTLARQVSFATLGLTALIAAAVMVSPRDPDQALAFTQMSWLSPYNRWASGLAVIATVALIAPAGRRGAPEALLIGALIALLCLLKITYGAALIGLVLVALVLRNLSVLHGLNVVIGAAATAVWLEAATGQVLPYLEDLRIAAGFGQSGLRLGKLNSQLGEAAAWTLGAMALYVVLRGAAGARAALRPPMLIAVAGAMGACILMQNHWSSESVIYSALPLVAAEWAGLFGAGFLGAAAAAPAPAPASPRGGLFQRKAVPEAPAPGAAPLRKGLVWLAAALALVMPLRDAGTVLAQHALLRTVPADPLFAGTPLGGMALTQPLRAAPWLPAGAQYAQAAEGLGMLRRHGADGPEAGATLALGFGNPFPALLGRPSPMGAPIWLDYQRSYADDPGATPPERLLAGVQFVMQSRGEVNGPPLWRIYGPAVEAEFELLEIGETWALWRRKPG